jgi:hypothetical protein
LSVDVLNPWVDVHGRPRASVAVDVLMDVGKGPPRWRARTGWVYGRRAPDSSSGASRPASPQRSWILVASVGLAQPDRPMARGDIPPTAGTLPRCPDCPGPGLLPLAPSDSLGVREGPRCDGGARW